MKAALDQRQNENRLLSGVLRGKNKNTTGGMENGSMAKIQNAEWSPRWRKPRGCTPAKTDEYNEIEPKIP
jgi:hypothetical protein